MNLADLYQKYHLDNCPMEIDPITVAPSICKIVEKLMNSQRVTSIELALLQTDLAKVEATDHDAIATFLVDISYVIYEKKYYPEVEELHRRLEQQVVQGGPINNSAVSLSYQVLNSLFLLQSSLQFKTKNSDGDFLKKQLQQDIYLGLNTMYLLGMVPAGNARPMHPIYPPAGPSLTRGIKDANRFFLFQAIYKVHAGATGDHTFKATDGKKLMYVRSVEHYSPFSVLASKVATVISQDHFSSECLLSNGLVASKALPDFVCNLTDEGMTTKIKHHNQFIAGVGIVDEVLNFVNEHDNNPENFALSSVDLLLAHLCKIDFDGCYSFMVATEENYEKDIASHLLQKIFDENASAFNIQLSPIYQQEKMLTRLKLALFSPGLIMALATKAYAASHASHASECEDAVIKFINKTQLVASMLEKNPLARQMIQSNPQLIEQLTNRIKQYVVEHFSEPHTAVILRSLDQRKELVSAQLTTANPGYRM